MRYMTVRNLPKGHAFVARMDGGIIEGWNSTRKTWIRDNELISMFLGFDEGYEISEEEEFDLITKYSK